MRLAFFIIEIVKIKKPSDGKAFLYFNLICVF